MNRMAARAVVVLAFLVGGCMGDMKTLLSLEGGQMSGAEQTFTVTEKGTYYLYAKTVKDKEEIRFRKELKKGDVLGFKRKGNEIQAFAAGTIIELSEAQEGTNYYWKLEEKKD